MINKAALRCFLFTFIYFLMVAEKPQVFGLYLPRCLFTYVARNRPRESKPLMRYLGRLHAKITSDRAYDRATRAFAAVDAQHMLLTGGFKMLSRLS